MRWLKALGPRALGPWHQTAVPIPNPSAPSPLHLSAKHESSFLIVNRLPASHLFQNPRKLRPLYLHLHWPVCPAPKELFNWHKSAESKKGKNRREERLKRCTFARALSLPPWAADLKSGPWEGPARPRGGAAQVQVQGGAVACLHLQPPARAAPADPTRPSQPAAASQVLCSCRPCFAPAFSPTA